MTFKKLIGFGLCLLAILTLASCSSFSDTEYAIAEKDLTFDIYKYDQYENSTVRITGVDSTPAHLIIPEKINGMTVVEIAENAFQDNYTMIYLELPAGSIKLGKGFCSGAVALITVNLSGSVSVIPNNAFEGCTNLTRVDGMRGVTEINSQAFAGCPSLTSLEFPETLTLIGSEAFRGCTALSSLKLPASITSVGESAFWSCVGLSTVDFACNAEIPQYCFLDCSSLTSIRIGDGVPAIRDEAFRNCHVLYSIEIGKSCKTIADYAFHACDQLTEIVFADKSGIYVGEGNDSLGYAN